MKANDTEGDMVNDCLLIDRNHDGSYISTPGITAG